MLILSDEAVVIKSGFIRAGRQSGNALSELTNSLKLADFQSQFLTKETEEYVKESSFIGNSAELIYTLFLLKDAERWNFGA